MLRYQITATFLKKSLLFFKTPEYSSRLAHTPAVLNRVKWVCAAWIVFYIGLWLIFIRILTTMATTKKAPVKTYSKLNIQFGEHLRSLRKEKGLSLRQMEELCDLDNSNISKIENGKFDIQLSTIVELAKGLNVHPRELLDYHFT